MRETWEPEGAKRQAERSLNTETTETVMTPWTMMMILVRTYMRRRSFTTLLMTELPACPKHRRGHVSEKLKDPVLGAKKIIESFNAQHWHLDEKTMLGICVCSCVLHSCVQLCVAFVAHRVCVMSRQVNGKCKFPPLGDAVVHLKDTSKTPTPLKVVMQINIIREYAHCPWGDDHYNDNTW